MAHNREVFYYRSGPIERDPVASFHAKNRVDEFLIESGFEIIGDTFEHLEKMKRPQSVYGIEMKKLRDQGLILKYSEKELLLVMSFRKARRSDFIISRPAPTASGGTTSETVISWLKGVPKLVIIGPHHEGILDNDSTFMIRMLTDRYSLVFDTERDVINFIKKHIQIFRQGRNAIRQLILNIKKTNPFINDRPKLLWDDYFNSMNIIIQGRPGSGKDTQSRMFQDRYGLKFFGSGYELRKLYSKFPHLAESLGKGNAALSELIIYLITQRMIGLERFESIVFSGTPKLLKEAKAFIKISEFLNRKPTIIVIDISEKLSRKRILLRRNCDSCEISFCDMEFVKNPICPKCQGPLSARTENTNKKSRDKILAWYRPGGKVTKVIKYFEGLGMVTHIDGHQTKEKIFSDILEILKE